MKEDKKKEENKKLDIIKLVILTILLIALIVVSIVLIVKRQTNDDEQDDKVLAYTELVKEIQNKNVEKIEMTVGSTTLKVKLKDEEEEKKAIIPNTQVFMELIQSQTLEGNEIKLEQKTRSVISQIPSYFFSILPTAIMVALFIMIYKMQGLGDKGQVYEETERKTKITFDDIAGVSHFTQHFLCKKLKFFRCIFHNMTIIYRMNNCKSLAMITVCIRSKLMFHLMRLKICQTSAF